MAERNDQRHNLGCLPAAHRLNRMRSSLDCIPRCLVSRDEGVVNERTFRVGVIAIALKSRSFVFFYCWKRRNCLL